MTNKDSKAFTEETISMYDSLLTPDNMKTLVASIEPIIEGIIIAQLKKETDEEMRNHPEFGDLHKLLYPSHE